MPTADILSWWPAWLALAVSSVIAINRAIEESEKFANILGGWARRLHERASRRHKSDVAAAEIAAAVQSALERAQKSWRTDENKAMKALDDRLGAVYDITSEQKRDLDEMRFMVRCMTAYTEYEALWHHRLRLVIARSENGSLDLEQLPDHIDYYEFEALYRKNSDWRNWAIEK